MTLEIISVTQGTPEWEAHRAQHYNASDAPAMLGVSPYKTRAQLVREHATGVTAEIDETTQRRFDDGHRFEALARPLAEKLIGEELFPCVGVLKGTKYSASFDGLTMLFDTAFEHKSLNDAIRNAIDDGIGNGVCLPEYLRVQMEQQCMVSGAERVLFMASKWNGETLVEERHCWYYPDAALREKIVNGWAQFDADVAAYQPEPEVLPAPAGRTPDQLPALHIEVTGMVTASNLHQWKEAAIAVFQGISTDLQTDQDFADADKTVKWCAEIEDQLKAAKQHALSQTASIDELFRTIDAISAEARAKRLELDKLVKARKESIRTEIVATGAAAVRSHYDTINSTLGEFRIQPPQSLQMDIGAAIKGKKSISSMRDAVDAAAAAAKIEASQRAERVRANIAIFDRHADHRHMFADAVELARSKAPDDLLNLVAARIAEHQQREAARVEAERERIRQEEAARLEREQRERERAALPPANEPYSKGDEASAAAEPTPAAAAASTKAAGAAPMPAGARLTLGEINARIAPLTITAAGLAQLGFQPVAVERAAKLYRLADLPVMCEHMRRCLARAASLEAAA